MSGNRRIEVICVACRRATSSVPDWVDRYADFDVKHGLIACGRCEQLMVIAQPFQHSEKADMSWPSGEPKILWPTEDPPLSLVIPDSPRQSFEEARACLRAGQHTASALMVRRTLEAVCTDKGAVGGSLQARLDDLRAKRIIEGNLASWSHDLRALGNDAAHDTSVFVSADDAQDALELAEALLSYVYVLNTRYDAFKARRATAAVVTAPAGAATLGGP